MANSDILITSAGNFQPVLFDIKKQKALLILAKIIATGSYATGPSTAQLQTIISNFNTAFKGIPMNERRLLACANAVWWKEAEGNGGGNALAVAGTSSNTRFATARYLMELDIPTLDALNLYVEGVLEAILT